MRGFVFIFIIISYLYLKLFEWVKLLLIVCRQVLLLVFNWHSWEIYVYSLVALLKLGYFLVVGPIKHKQTVSSKTTCFRFLCFCFAVGKFGSVGGWFKHMCTGSCFFQNYLFQVFVSTFRFFLIWVSCRFWFKTCARGAASSETNDQLQAAKLANSTNSAATFPSYWPITFTCQDEQSNLERKNSKINRPCE